MLMNNSEHWEEPRQFIPRVQLAVEAKSRTVKKLNSRKRAIILNLAHCHEGRRALSKIAIMHMWRSMALDAQCVSQGETHVLKHVSLITRVLAYAI